MADLRDAVVIFSGRQSRDAVLLRIHAHGAEFQDLEFPAVLGQSGLPVECRAAVGADEEREHDHERTQDHQREGGQYDVEQPFEEQILRHRVVAMDQKHRQMHQVHLLRAAHDHVPDSRNDIRNDVMQHAELENLVAVVAVKAAEEDDINPRDAVLHIIWRQLADMHRVLHVVPHIEAMFLNQPLQSLHLIIDDDGLLFCKISAVPAVGRRRPDRDDSKVHGQA